MKFFPALVALFVLITPCVKGSEKKLSLEELSCQPLSSEFNRFHASFFEELFALTAESPEEIREDVYAFLFAFEGRSVQVAEGEDAILRPVYVSVQGDFEKVMAYFMKEGKINHLMGIIHTPTPATPLCSQGEISPDLVAASLEDAKRLFTVMKRPEIIREFLAQGGVLIAAYPESGREKRTSEQLAIFEKLKGDYPENLIDIPLQCLEMEKEMIGATYLFQTQAGDWMAFGIRASQANAPEDNRQWGMWFGSLQDPEVFNRVQSVFAYLHDVQSQDLIQLLNNF